MSARQELRRVVGSVSCSSERSITLAECNLARKRGDVGKNEAALRAMTVALNLAPHDRHAARCLAGG
jgi:hypothetical protein